MSLSPTGREVKTLTGVNAQATDDDDATVIVAATTEAIQDYSWSTIWSAASDKYDEGHVDRTGQVPIVSVSTSDCANWVNGNA